MKEFDLDFTEVQAAARRRWPELYGKSGRKMDKVATAPDPSTEGVRTARTRAIQNMGESALREATSIGLKGMAAAEREQVQREVTFRDACPVFRIVRGEVDLEEARSGQETWFEAIKDAQSKLADVFAGIGRIEANITGRKSEPLGTGWLLGDDIIVTNKHVAYEFAQFGSGGIRFRSQLGYDRDMTASLDFADDANDQGNSTIVIDDILFMPAQDDPDIAILRLEPGSSAGRKKLPRSTAVIDSNHDVAIVGYPERDDRADKAEVERLFGNIWGCKRFAPGLLGQIDAKLIRHLCNTLGGNSGSPLIDMATGEVIGLHYGGVYERANYAIPVSAIEEVLKQLGSAPMRRREAAVQAPEPTPSGWTPSATVGAVPGRLVIPLTLSIELALDGTANAAVQNVALAVSESAPPAPDLDAAVVEARKLLAGRDDVVGIRSGWREADGWITDEPAIVVAVQEKMPLDTLARVGRSPIPSSIAGFAVDIAAASPADLIAQLGVGISAEAARRSTYKPRPDLAPPLINERLKLSIQPGPDAGSGMLTDFLMQTQRKLTVGMYDFTAPHLIDAMLTAMKPDKRLKMVLQKGESLAPKGSDSVKANDVPDERTAVLLEDAMGSRFANQWASVGSGAVFPYAYHIKVAARDDEAIWLSSGNWQSSNQPAKTFEQDSALLGKHNREFHVTIEHPQIAKLYRQHIERDFDEAHVALERPAAMEAMFWVPDDLGDSLATEAAQSYRYFEPLTVDRQISVQPLLTPDNYAEHMLPLIRSARKSIVFQNQSFNIIEDLSSDFRAMLDALLAQQQRKDVEVRIILRGEFARDQIEKMKTYGFAIDHDNVRVQRKCHNKMWIFDDQHSVIGSHNFTNSGTTRNRDASLIFRDDPEIAQYCRPVFDYDWQRSASMRLPAATRAARFAHPGETPPRGMHAAWLSTLGLD